MNLKIIFLGTTAFALPSLRMLIRSAPRSLAVVTRPDRPAGRGKKYTATPVKVQALQYALPLFQPEDGDGLLQVLHELQPQVLVNVAYGMFLPAAVLDFPPLGCINLHPSLLPAYRGAAPIQRALMAGEEYTGVTVMFMSSKLDAGDLILQEKVKIAPNDTFASLHDRLAKLGAIKLHDALELLEAGKAPRLSQDEAAATYAPALSREEEKIPWHQPALKIHNLVRALNPLPGAFTLFRGKRLKIWETSVLTVAGKGACSTFPAGTVCSVAKDCFIVSTGRGWIKVLELQLEGKRRNSAREFLKGCDLREGERLE